MKSPTPKQVLVLGFAVAVPVELYALVRPESALGLSVGHVTLTGSIAYYAAERPVELDDSARTVISVGSTAVVAVAFLLVSLLGFASTAAVVVAVTALSLVAVYR